jgi:hypothetical protein
MTTYAKWYQMVKESTRISVISKSSVARATRKTPRKSTAWAPADAGSVVTVGRSL